MSKPVISVDEPPVTFSVTSGFGHRKQAPFVQVLIEAADFMTQMPPSKARELAHNLLAAAEAAETDAFIIGFFREKVQIDDPRIVAILTDFREWRQSHAD